ncbi:PREDICTED: probable aminotransferase TAT2 [Prunus mume]|uniref:Probable aminotransferase TAT2 n=1 Tax=Prunus mume TaxID=102107 RepID=A0ABM0NS51_PRUMU|nr:PREDICTED: probable aminotransferase TAT2 [Prunus mume]
MENGSQRKWQFGGNEELNTAAISVRGALAMLMNNVNNPDDGDHHLQRPTMMLGRGDPTEFRSFWTTQSAVDAVTDALQSFKFNSYCPTGGVLEARRAIAEYLSRDLSHKLLAEDVYLTGGCTQAIEIMVSVLARPGSNILLPRPGYPQYEARASFDHLEVRHFDLLPEKGWEVDLDAVEALADHNTAAIVIINPSNPCGNVFTYQHLEKIAKIAKKLGIFVISDEVYGHLTFGSNPFVPMGKFSSTVPVITLGSISKTWIVPGWKLGWIVKNDPKGIFDKTGIVDSIKNYLDITTDPATFIQGAIPQIFDRTKETFFSNIIGIMREAADIVYEMIKEIPCLTCPHKPQGSMVVLVKLNLSTLEGIDDDIQFCLKLAKEESVIVLPGVTVGLKNWLRITFAVELPVLEDGLRRIKAFYQRHAKKQ